MKHVQGNYEKDASHTKDHDCCHRHLHCVGYWLSSLKSWFYTQKETKNNLLICSRYNLALPEITIKKYERRSYCALEFLKRKSANSTIYPTAKVKDTITSKCWL